MNGTDPAFLLRRAIAREDLDASMMREAIEAIVEGRWSGAQAGALLAALATKGESVVEIVSAARVLRERSLHVEHDLPLVVDTCGTGGDGYNTINISTAAALTIAGCGVPVAKHGGRAASGRCGSADVLEALGVGLDDDPQEARKRLERDRFAFLFAPRYHPVMKSVGPLRRELGVRTLFNLLGPLANPAGATHQVLGTADEARLEVLGEALRELGVRSGAVLHAADGMDEIAGEGPTYVYQFDRERARRYILDPSDFGIRASREALIGGDVAVNAAALRAILEGERSPCADVTALNAALALLVAGRAESFREGLELAYASLRNGAALAVLEASRRDTLV